MGALFTPIKLPKMVCSCRHQYIVQVYLFPHQEMFPQGVKKVNRTSWSDPVCCFRDQNITSWLFLTSKQTLAGPLLPQNPSVKKQSAFYLRFKLLRVADGCSKIQRDRKDLASESPQRHLQPYSHASLPLSDHKNKPPHLYTQQISLQIRCTPIYFCFDKFKAF